MKILLLSLVTVMSFGASAMDLAETHQTLCSSEEVKSQMGENDTCRVVIGLTKTVESEGRCTGKFRGVMHCGVDFFASAQGAGIHIVCGYDPKNPALDQVIEASAVSYKVAAIVTKADNSQVVISDAGEHGILESGMLNITVSKYESTTSASISLNMKTGPEELTDVVCQ